MTNLFNALYTLMHRRPVRVLGIAALCLLLLLPGIPLVNLATGIETLIKPSTSVYKDNIELENSFGGESIVLMYTSDNAKETLSAANLQQFNAIETALQHTPGVYSVITPSTVVKQMTKKQSEKMQEGVANMSSGLLEMSDKLRQMADGTAGQKTSLGASAGSSNGKNPAEALGTLAQGQEQMSAALGKMQTEFGTLQAKQTALPAQLSKQEEGLSNLSDKLKELGSGLDTISQHASNLEPGVPKTQENLDELLYDNGKLRDMFKNVIVDDQHILSIVRLEGNLEDETKEAAIARVEQLVQEHPVEGASVMVSGKSVLDTALRVEKKYAKDGSPSR
ncbi:MAG: MMPL family transporter [Thermincola sp.]|jgi:predicted RND superfamily exporter protein|nr:MMPL family transporter [Thermincola sp.]MDT3702261.1 MMPL family transporter [Thermincola sp.]